jgi:hypothetical protein
MRCPSETSYTQCSSWLLNITVTLFQIVVMPPTFTLWDTIRRSEKLVTPFAPCTLQIGPDLALFPSL